MNDALRLLPALVILQIALLALEWRRARRRGARRPWALAALAAILFLVTWPPASWLAAGTLEWWYSSTPRPAGDAEAIVVLSGGVLQPRSHRPVPFLGRDTYTRSRHAAWLYKSWRALPVLVSGGATDPRSPGDSLAEAMKEYLVAEGMPRDEVWIEDRSTTTLENARRSAEILREKGIRRIVLVTEGYHMLRADLAFRAQGLEVVPAPCGLRAAEVELEPSELLPSAGALEWNERVLHEWLGLAWYWMRGAL